MLDLNHSMPLFSKFSREFLHQRTLLNTTASSSFKVGDRNMSSEDTISVAVPDLKHPSPVYLLPGGRGECVLLQNTP